jgi:hypothetical protein
MIPREIRAMSRQSPTVNERKDVRKLVLLWITPVKNIKAIDIK